MLIECPLCKAKGNIDGHGFATYDCGTAEGPSGQYFQSNACKVRHYNAMCEATAKTYMLARDLISSIDKYIASRDTAVFIEEVAKKLNEHSNMDMPRVQGKSHI